MTVRGTADPVFGPPVDCRQCPRLADFRDRWAATEPEWHNRPVPSFGDPNARLLIVGLAPGLRGANKTGRPFTGDYAGDLLYATLAEFGYLRGTYAARPDDGISLTGAMITNAVRCVPPENKPTGAEIKTCRPYLAGLIERLPNLKVLLALGRIAHDSTLSTLGRRRAAFPFGHNVAHDVGSGLALFDSYHCSRYNTNTGRLTPEMFRDVFRAISDRLVSSS